MEMLDHPYVASLLTCCNKREGDGFLARKLDRSLVNDLGPSTFPQTMMEFLPPGVYDHAAISISPPKPFIYIYIFLNFWTNHVGFLNLVETGLEPRSPRGPYVHTS